MRCVRVVRPKPRARLSSHEVWNAVHLRTGRAAGSARPSPRAQSRSVRARGPPGTACKGESQAKEVRKCRSTGDRVMPVTIKKSPRDLRDEVEALVRDDLIGPFGGP